MIRSQMFAETYAAIDEIMHIGNRAVSKAQENNRRLGVPNVYAINDRRYDETSTGELSTTDFFGNRHRKNVGTGAGIGHQQFSIEELR